MSKAVLINEINYLVDPAVAAYFDVEEHMFTIDGLNMKDLVSIFIVG